MIDLADCDCLLPSVFDIRPNLEFDAERRPYLFNSALISLSILLGRILKMVYSPSRLTTKCVCDVAEIGATLSWYYGSLGGRRGETTRGSGQVSILVLTFGAKNGP